MAPRAVALLAFAVCHASPVLAAVPGPDFRTLYDAGMKLHKELEFEAALESFRAARTRPHDTEQEVALALFEGILLFELGKQADAEASFRAALVLRPETALPVKVSPRIEFLFESIRSQVRPPQPPAPPPAGAPAPRSAAEDGLALPPAGYAGSAQGDGLAGLPDEGPPRKVRKLPIALMAVGGALLLGGGALTGYTALGGGFVPGNQAQVDVAVGLCAGGAAFLLAGVLVQLIPETGGAAVAVAPTRSGVAIAASIPLP